MTIYLFIGFIKFLVSQIKSHKFALFKKNQKHTKNMPLHTNNKKKDILEHIEPRRTAVLTGDDLIEFAKECNSYVIREERKQEQQQNIQSKQLLQDDNRS